MKLYDLLSWTTRYSPLLTEDIFQARQSTVCFHVSSVHVPSISVLHEPKYILDFRNENIAYFICLLVRFTERCDILHQPRLQFIMLLIVEYIV